MRYFLGQTQLYPNSPFEHQQTGVKYPANWLALSSAEDRTAVGITELDEIPVDPTPLASVKARRISAINAECHARITAVWPLEKQISATLGIYGVAELDAMTTFIDAHISASNTASDAVDAAADQSAVEAVTVTWPA